MKKSILLLAGLALWLFACVPQDATNSNSYTQEQLEVLQVLNGTFVSDADPDIVIIIESYSKPREIVFGEEKFTYVHGEMINPDDLSLSIYFIISDDGETFTMFGTGFIDDEPFNKFILYDIVILSNSSFKIKEKGDDAYNPYWIYFVKIY
ncbi:MAG: hypothetical protein GX281_02500 [Bacteroidales bacterium]|mgnify:CR=1 FL=1|jgi:hypothetical protein|nr:hypothetical protein [Bacteroidales bacterium]NLK79579.1 hypothetical protein [Bacteroidales bacterium]HQB22909.1 hypothetical protein [Bacteroidales bacterium]